jgi:hypothetical protein
MASCDAFSLSMEDLMKKPNTNTSDIQKSPHIPGLHYSRNPDDTQAHHCPNKEIYSNHTQRTDSMKL